MSDLKQEVVTDICAFYDNDRFRLLDILIAVQDRAGCVSGESMVRVAAAVGVERVEVEGVVSF